MKKDKKTIPNFGKNPPHVSLKNVIEYLEAAIKGGGTTGSYDDLTKAVNSTSIGSSAFHVRRDTMKAFGLIRIDKIQQTYTVEPIGITIASAITPEQRQEAIRKVMLGNPVIRKIWETFKGNIIPPRESLGINLASRLPEEIPELLKEKWANYFYDSAEYATFFDKRVNGNYLKASEPNPDQTLEPEKGKDEEIKPPFLPPNRNQPTGYSSSPDTINLSKTLSSGRVLTIEFPEEYGSEESEEMIKRFNMAINTVRANVKQNGQT